MPAGVKTCANRVLQSTLVPRHPKRSSGGGVSLAVQNRRGSSPVAPAAGPGGAQLTDAETGPAAPPPPRKQSLQRRRAGGVPFWGRDGHACAVVYMGARVGCLSLLLRVRHCGLVGCCCAALIPSKTRYATPHSHAVLLRIQRHSGRPRGHSLVLPPFLSATRRLCFRPRHVGCCCCCCLLNY